MRGKFIVVEGGEGSGKTTFITALSEMLSKHNVDHIMTREPGGTEDAEKIRSLIVNGNPDRLDALEEALLFNAARRHHLRTKIIPALEKGIWVICDRFLDSTLVYQGKAKGVAESTLLSLHKEFCFDLFPDNVFVLDVSPAVGLERAHNRANGEDRFEKMEVAFHDTVRHAFIEKAQKNKQYVVLDSESRSLEDSVKVAFVELMMEGL